MSEIMYDKTLIESVCNLSCDFNALNRSQTTIKYDDTPNAFDKYYSLKSIIKAIELYETGKITAKNLANWMCIYDWIINGGFGKGYNERYKQNISVKEIVEWEISEWLDSLSFFDWNIEENDIENLANAKKSLAALDKILQCADRYNEGYVYEDDSRGRNSIFLMKNSSEKRYALFRIETKRDDSKNSPQIKKVEENEFNKILSELTEAGYHKDY